MENLTKAEFISYFSPEILTTIGIIINLLLFIFFSSKTNCKKISDILTSTVLLINSIILLFFLNGSFKYGFCISNNNLFMDWENIGIKFFANLFALVFVLITYKLTRRAKYRVPVLNASLLLILLAIDIFSLSVNILLPFIMLDVVSFLLYKHTSFLKHRNKSIFDLNFILINIIASLLFYGFYIAKLFANDALMIILLDVFVSFAILFKTGIFPLFNYQKFKNFRLNLPYSILLGIILPFCGVIAFCKISKFLTLSSEIYLMSMVVFLVFSMISFAIFAYRTKNLVTLATNFTYFICSFCVVLTIFQIDFNLTFKILSLNMLIMLSFYSLISIAKQNLKSNKITFLQINGTYLNNPFYAFILSLTILFSCGIIPSGITKTTLIALKELYLYDKNALILIAICTICMILITINLLKLIQNLYTFKKELLLNQMKKFTKKTTLNYVASLVIILILIICL